MRDQLGQNSYVMMKITIMMVMNDRRESRRARKTESRRGREMEGEQKSRREGERMERERRRKTRERER